MLIAFLTVFDHLTFENERPTAENNLIKQIGPARFKNYVDSKL